MGLAAGAPNHMTGGISLSAFGDSQCDRPVNVLAFWFQKPRIFSFSLCHFGLLSGWEGATLTLLYYDFFIISQRFYTQFWHLITCSKWSKIKEYWLYKI